MYLVSRVVKVKEPVSIALNHLLFQCGADPNFPSPLPKFSRGEKATAQQTPYDNMLIATEEVTMT